MCDRVCVRVCVCVFAHGFGGGCMHMCVCLCADKNDAQNNLVCVVGVFGLKRKSRDQFQHPCVSNIDIQKITANQIIPSSLPTPSVLITGFRIVYDSLLIDSFCPVFSY